MNSQVKINDILKQNRVATREELNSLFFQAVCPDTCPAVVRILTDREIKRLVSIKLLEYWILDCERDRGFAIKIVGQLTGLRKTALYEFTAAFCK